MILVPQESHYNRKIFIGVSNLFFLCYCEAL